MFLFFDYKEHFSVGMVTHFDWSVRFASALTYGNTCSVSVQAVSWNVYKYSESTISSKSVLWLKYGVCRWRILGYFLTINYYLHARNAEYVVWFSPTAVFLNPKVFIKNFSMGWRSHANIWSIVYFTLLLIGIIKGGGLRYTNIQCSGINLFSVHFVKRVKK
jgi:hypothetical protein